MIRLVFAAVFTLILALPAFACHGRAAGRVRQRTAIVVRKADGGIRTPVRAVVRGGSCR